MRIARVNNEYYGLHEENFTIDYELWMFSEARGKFHAVAHCYRVVQVELKVALLLSYFLFSTYQGCSVTWSASFLFKQRLMNDACISMRRLSDSFRPYLAYIGQLPLIPFSHCQLVVWTCDWVAGVVFRFLSLKPHFASMLVSLLIGAKSWGLRRLLLRVSYQFKIIQP